jgi:phospholipase C
VEVDDAVRQLEQIDHIVVLMMENRSFDHMLGYLRLSGRRPELDGLLPDMSNTYRDNNRRFPEFDGVAFPVHELLETRMKKSQDPPHGGSSVDKQLAEDNGGFVQTYMDERGGPTEVHPSDVMGYHTERHLPVYDHLAEKFCVCDRWFSSVAGSTFPNRLYSVAGRHSKWVHSRHARCRTSRGAARAERWTATAEPRFRLRIWHAPRLGRTEQASTERAPPHPR